MAASGTSVGGGLRTVIQYRATTPGDVVVHWQGKVYAMPKHQALALRDGAGKRIYHATRKPAISAHDLKVAKEYKRVEKKLKRIGSSLDLKTEHKLASRGRRSTRKPPIQEAIILKED